MSKDEWIKSWQNQFPDAATDVLEFIYNITSRGTPNATRTIENLFANGYCYYFAIMLKDAFGGEIMWSKGRSHIVWMDTRVGNGYGIAYEIYGVYYDYEMLLPVERLKDDLESFRHRGHDFDVALEVEAYRDKYNLAANELNELVYTIIPKEDRVYEYPNLGDTYRYWSEFKNKNKR